MSLLDILTGGQTSAAEGDLNSALANIAQVQAPTVQQLTLPELQQYVQQGLMTPAEAQSYLQQNNAYATENTPQTGTAAMQDALAQLSSIADAGPMGTPVEQAQIAQTQQQLNNTVQGQRGAIEQQMEAKGTPAALIQAALQNQYVGQDAQQAYQNSLNSQAAAYQAAVQAMAEKGNLGTTMQGQQNAQSNTVAQAQNAMQQFNAANQQQTSALNAQLKQQANQVNQSNAQNVANQNVQQNNARTAYNANLPETVFNNQMQKATGMSGVNEAKADQATKAGQQQAGLYGGLLGAGSNMAGNYMLSNSLSNLAGAGGAGAAGASGYGGAVATGAELLPMLAGGGMVQDKHQYCYHDGGICMESGGTVPGHPRAPGNSLKNDTVHIMASPGEAVIPRTAVAAHPMEVQHLIAQGRGIPPPAAPAHPHDVASVLEALRQIRGA